MGKFKITAEDKAYFRKRYNQSDKNTLWALRLHRCLTADQLTRLVYKRGNVTQNHLSALQRLKMVDFIEFKPELKGTATDKAYYLTVKGFDMLKYLKNLNYKNPYGMTPSAFWDLPTADVKMTKQNKIPHQIIQNDFAIMLHNAAKTKAAESYAWIDEVYIHAEMLADGVKKRDDSRQARPDAIVIINGRPFLFENDMNTESQKQLFTKWDRYITFLRYGTSYTEESTYCLFSLGKCASVRRRTNTVLTSMEQRTDEIPNKNFDVIVDTPEKLIDFIFDIENYEDKVLAPGESISLPYSLEFQNYQGEYIDNGKVMLFDHYDWTDTYVLKKLQNFKKDKMFIEKLYNLPVEYTIITQNPKKLEQDLDCFSKKTGNTSKGNYTTVESVNPQLSIQEPEIIIDVLPEPVNSEPVKFEPESPIEKPNQDDTDKYKDICSIPIIELV